MDHLPITNRSSSELDCQDIVMTKQSYRLPGVLLVACLVAAQDSYRLPGDLAPRAYSLSVRPLFDGDPRFEGNVTILLQVVSATSAVVLHAAPTLDVSVLSALDGDTGDALEVLSSDWLDTTDRDFFSVQLAEQLEVGSTISLSLSFSGSLASDMKGFYLSTYQHQRTTRYIAATKFEPTYARRAFPCLDEPALKATFQLTVITPAGYSAMAGSSATVSASSVFAGHEEFVFAALPAVSSYLVAWAVFEPASFGRSVLVGAVGGPYGIASDSQLSAEWPLPLRAASATLREMNGIFNDSLNYYSFMQTLGLVALPDFISGAMENWGMITFRERRLLASDSSTSPATQQSVVTTISHEIAHQWFGDLVSPAWWSYLWLNEGFATYWSYHLDLALDEDDDWLMREQFVVSELQAALRSDASSTTHPMTYDRQTPDEIQGVFDSVNYEKAASVIRMFEHLMGTPAFQAGLRNYLMNNMYSAVSETELFSALDEQLSQAELRLLGGARKLGDIFYSWSRSAGYPVLTVTRNYSSAEVHVTQARFFGDPLDAVEGAEAPWLVPVTASWPAGETAPQVVGGAGPHLLAGVAPDSDHWLVVNFNQTGYYRVQYDERNWRLVQAQLRTDATALSRVTRAQLLGDALALASAGQLAWDAALNLTRYLSAELDYLPWAAALDNLQLLRRRLASSPANSYLHEYVGSVMENAWQRLGGYEGSAELPHLQQLLHQRLLAWACLTGQHGCLQLAQTEFRWLYNSTSRSVSAARRAVVYCAGLAASSEQLADQTFQHMWSLYSDSATPPNEKNTILTALGCLPSQQTIHTYLQRAVDLDGVRLQDVTAVFSAVASSVRGAQMALSYLQDNGDAVRQRLEEIGEVESVVNGIAQWLPRDQQSELLSAVSEWGISESLEKTLASLNGWLDRNEAALTAWLQRETASQEPPAAAARVATVAWLLLALAAATLLL